MKNTIDTDRTVVARNGDYLEDLVNRLDLKTDASREFLKMALTTVMLFDRKQQDYGPRNISKHGTFGVLVRMSDKFERLAYLYGKKGQKRRTLNESIFDSFRDIACYATIALMLETDVWPKT